MSAVNYLNFMNAVKRKNYKKAEELYDSWTEEELNNIASRLRRSENVILEKQTMVSLRPDISKFLYTNLYEISPKNVFGKSFRSGRTYTEMGIFEIAEKEADFDNPLFLEETDLDACFCLKNFSSCAEYQDRDILIPVTRYALSKQGGYYYRTESDTDLSKIEKTWYYFEPESRYYLKGRKVAVLRNKIIAGIISQCPEVMKFIAELAIKNELSKETIINLLIEDKEVRIGNSSYSNYFRNVHGIPTVEDYDSLDNCVDAFKSLGYDYVVFTHQTGTGRLTTEIVDLRPRSVSFDNLYHVEREIRDFDFSNTKHIAEEIQYFAGEKGMQIDIFKILSYIRKQPNFKEIVSKDEWSEDELFSYINEAMK